MQPTGLNALAALVAAPPAQSTGAGANNAVASGTDDGALENHFSQLLSDSGHPHDDQQMHQQVVAAKMLQSSTSNILSAQEVLSPAEQIAQLLAQREQMVSPDDAKNMMKKLDTMIGQSTDTTETQALSQLKEQLQNIITTGTPRSIAAILTAAPAVQDAKLSLVSLTALLTPKKPAAATSDTHDDDDMQEESAAVATQAPVVVFRPDAGTVTPDTASAKSDTKKEVKKDDSGAVKKIASGEVKKDDSNKATVDASDATVSVIVPLAAVITQAVAIPSPAVPQQIAGSDISTRDNMPPAAIKPRSDIDQIIPPLTSNDGNDDLPEVNLPKAGTIADANADKAAASNFQSLAATAGAEAAKATDDKQANGKLQADLSTLNNVAQTGSGTATQTASAVQPVSVIQTPGIVNHAPVTDQVSVGVTKAAADGISHITIQLDPAGLGRVEVNMHTGHDGQTQISFTVDKADTFDNLSRDARTLERSLQEAGIKADTGSMQFNMRQQPQPQQLHSDMGNGQGQRSQQQANAEGAPQTSSSTTSIASIIPPTPTRNYLFNVREGVDISA